ncbi:uncharacterized protein FIBRA_09219 [Fibroporia radiculosa]|uniref:Uncharacterized protein n=1 Tax=Fibroporia radiculosa TaxID=599839 RepID=J7SCU2_9APHY|nr:uncharacterized protein FIBRA_09219 [Fibroporia radiculosa]CCM06908.1 predicted protein [Fibroporia radiculosa]
MLQQEKDFKEHLDSIQEQITRIDEKTNRQAAGSGENEIMRLKVVQPSKFVQNTKEQTYKQFVEQCAMWFAHHMIDDDRQKINSVLTLLKGRAHTIVNNYYQ